jgi:hypothetical protein
MTPMQPRMIQARRRLLDLLNQHSVTSGMSIRIHGDHLILGRRDPDAPHHAAEDDDRVRLTRLSSRTYGLSVKRHTGRWEKTPFVGTLDEMVDSIHGFMQHLVAPY